MTPPKTNFWSILRKENPESQQKYALRKWISGTLLCSNDIFNPVYNQKPLTRSKTSILEGVCFNYEPLFCPVQCTACRKNQCSSREKRA